MFISKYFYSILFSNNGIGLMNCHSGMIWTWSGEKWEPSRSSMFYMDASHARRLVSACGKRGIAVPAGVANSVDKNRGAIWTGKRWF